MGAALQPGSSKEEEIKRERSQSRERRRVKEKEMRTSVGSDTNHRLSESTPDGQSINASASVSSTHCFGNQDFDVSIATRRYICPFMC